MPLEGDIVQYLYLLPLPGPVFFCRKVVCSQQLQPLLTELGGRESGSQKPPGPVIPFYCLTQPGVSEPISLCLLCVLYCRVSRSYCGDQPVEGRGGLGWTSEGLPVGGDFLTSSLVYFDSTFVVGLREEELLIALGFFFSWRSGFVSSGPSPCSVLSHSRL